MQRKVLNTNKTIRLQLDANILTKINNFRLKKKRYIYIF